MPPSVVAELAKGFDLRSGRLSVTVPSKIRAGKYTITREPELFRIQMKTSLESDTSVHLAVFGDSGDWSPDFQIKAAISSV